MLIYTYKLDTTSHLPSYQHMWVFHCHLLCKNVVFVLLKNNYLIHHGEVTCKLIILCTQFKKNTIKWKILILENFRKKSHQIWSNYDREQPISNFYYRLKRKIWSIHQARRATSSSRADPLASGHHPRCILFIFPN